MERKLIEQPATLTPGPDGAKCEDCRHYYRESETVGYCRSHPPIGQPIFDRQGNMMGMTSAWPPTRPDNWCGEFKPVTH
jgi:hypothetical protein